jgi:2,4-dienoyl-CoA reductase-like NADH-dependent reductase (Old Yellow Enzyme family)
MIFEKFKIKHLKFRNKIFISPMCQYSSKDGCPSDWHYRHLGNLMLSGAGGLVVESTAVNMNGRISPADLCIEKKFQKDSFHKLIKYLKKINDMPILLQISHSGRKGSSQVPWIKSNTPLKRNSWTTFSSSNLRKDINWPKPKSLSNLQIKKLIKDFKKATINSLQSGFDGIEIHMAHGYLLHQFLSPISNIRKDEYGGNQNNRMRFPLEIIKEIKKIVPKNFILGARITATDHLKNGLKINDSIILAKKLESLGVDYICVSSGGILTKTNLKFYNGFRVKYANTIKQNVKIPVRCSGMLSNLNYANKLIMNRKIDCVAIARAFLGNPFWLRKTNKVKIPPQYTRGI